LLFQIQLVYRYVTENKTTAGQLFKAFDKDKSQFLSGDEVTKFCAKFVDGGGCTS
jgi:hypothetical protein